MRNLSRSTDGLLAFTYNGDLYTMTEGQEPHKLTISLNADFGGDEISTIPIKGEASEMAKAALFLASDDSGWLTGEIILASGGLR